MTKDDAKRLIQKTFESKFDKDSFKSFIRNIFRAKLDNRTKHGAGNLIWHAFQNFITSWESIGKYEDNDGNVIDILTVKLKRFGSIEAARTAQRNFVKKYLLTYEKTAALVAFYHEDSDDWRFSYVKTEFSLATKKDETTPAKRLSYPVGAYAKSHTAQKQLIQLLTNSAPPQLSDLEQAFSIEIVTKEFFDRYLSLFKSLEIDLQNIIESDSVIQAEFAKHSISTTAFAKKLLGQIVFLYFIQKKGWLGVPADKKWGEGDRRFIRNLFAKCSLSGENFYNDYLEFLFYEALAEQRNDHNVPSYYSKFDCRIPFLNGGLFEPINDYDWKTTNINLDNSIFSNKIKTADGDIGTGILDVFDRYNFTVKEDEPLEKEVAVDPEMLGKVFENLLGTSERKSKGAFYTPREIVHYMCQESLVNFLETKLKDKYPNSEIPSQDDIRILIQMGNLFIELEQHIADLGKETGTYKSHLNAIKPFAKEMDTALAGIYICDPAIGSGAFPVGMLTEIVNAREVLQSIGSAERKLSTYDIKRHTIQHCLYGVDIDATAVDIAKLRLWLSLVVDEEDFDSIKPLPNLDYKIACGNSLLGLPENFTSNRMNELESLKQKYFEETNHDKKEVLRNEINSYMKPTFDNSERLYGYKIDFDFRINFSEVFSKNDGFDVVIGNPPYGAKYPEEHKKYFKENYESAKTREIKEDGKVVKLKGSLDTFSLFIDRSMQIMNNNSFLAFIVPLAVTSSDSMSALHRMMFEKCERIKLSTYSNRPKKIFDNADQRVAILCFTHNKSITKELLTTKVNKRYEETSINELIDNLNFVNSIEFVKFGRIPKVGSDLEVSILKKLSLINTTLNDLIVDKGKPVYYRAAGGRYYNIVTNFATNSSAEKFLSVKKDFQNIISALLSSNLYYWYYHIYSDTLNMKLYELEIMPIPMEKLKSNKETIENIYAEYLKDLHKNSKIKKVNYAHISEYREYYARKSKHLIDQIDLAIQDAYGLTDEEINFIINYDLKFRTDEE